jgi:hypothetical protein
VPNNITCDASGTASLCATVTAAGALKTDGSGVTQPVSGTFWQATQPVSLASLPALSAGSALIGEVGDGQASTTSGQNGPLVQGGTSTSAPSLTNGKTYPFSLNLNGGLRVDGSGVTQPVNGTVTANQGTAAGSGPWIFTPRLAGHLHDGDGLKSALDNDGSGELSPAFRGGHSRREAEISEWTTRAGRRTEL